MEGSQSVLQCKGGLGKDAPCCHSYIYLMGMAEAYVLEWKMKFNSRKSKVMVVGKREAIVS